MRWFRKVMVEFVICIMASNLYAEKLDVVWEKELGDNNNFSYVAHDAVYNDGALQIIGFAFDSQTQSSGKYWFWQINPDGNVISRENFHSVSNVRPSDIIFGSWKTKGMKVEQGSIYCIGKFGSNVHSFAKLGTSDKSFLKKQISVEANNVPTDVNKESAGSILKMINLSGNKFLFVGLDNKSKAIATKVDSDGDIYWHKVFDKGKISFINDGIEIESGLILIGCYTEGGPNNNYYEGYKCFLIRCDSEGNILSEKSFTGGGAFPNKYPELHRIDSNIFLVGYDKYSSRLDRIEYIVALYDNNLNLLSEKMIIDREIKNPIFAHISPVSTGGFIIAYNDSITKITVSKYSGTGEILATLSLDNYVVIDDFRIVGSDNKYFVIALSMPTKPNNLVKTKIAALTVE